MNGLHPYSLGNVELTQQTQQTQRQFLAVKNSPGGNPTKPLSPQQMQIQQPQQQSTQQQQQMLFTFPSALQPYPSPKMYQSPQQNITPHQQFIPSLTSPNADDKSNKKDQQQQQLLQQQQQQYGLPFSLGNFANIGTSAWNSPAMYPQSSQTNNYNKSTFQGNENNNNNNSNSHSLSFPFSTPELEDAANVNNNPKQFAITAASNFSQQWRVENSNPNNNLQHTNISTIKVKSASGSYISSSNSGSGFTNLQGLLQKKSYGEGGYDGQDKRQRLFHHKKEADSIQILKNIPDEGTVTPGTVSIISEQIHLTNINNSNNLSAQQLQLQNNGMFDQMFINGNVDKSDQQLVGQQQSQQLIFSEQQIFQNSQIMAQEQFIILQQTGQQQQQQLQYIQEDQILPQLQLPNQPQFSNQFWRNDSLTYKTIGGGTYKTGGTNQYTNVSKKQRELWRTKWMKLAVYIVKSIQSFKRILIFVTPHHLTKLQIALINDKSAHLHTLKEETQHRYKGWLFQSSNGGCVSRKNKKRILILLKKFKIIKRICLQIARKFKECIGKIDSCFPCLSPLVPAVQAFDFAVFCLTVFDALFIPFFLCFEQPDSSVASLILQKISVVVFIIDALKCLNTSYFERGQLIDDRWRILRRYASERLWIDALCIFSLLIYQALEAYKSQFLILCFYLRFIGGSHHVLQRLRETCLLRDKLNAIVNLTMLLSVVYFFAHVCACIWYYLGTHQSLDYPGQLSWLEEANIEHSSIFQKYIFSLHFALACFFSPLGNPVLPSTSSERLYIIGMNSLAYFVVAMVVHEAALILDALSQKRKEYLMQMKQICRYMEDHNVSEHYQSLARKYLEYVSSEGLDGRQSNPEKTLQGLSLQLREQIIQNAYLPRLKQISVFAKYFSESFLEKLSLKMGEQVLAPDEYVLSLHKLSSPRIYIVKKGSIESCLNIGTQRTNKHDSLKTFKTFKPNMYFGAFEFFSHNYKPHLSARSVGVSVVQYLALSDFLSLLEEFPEEREAYTYIKEMVTIYNKLDVIGVSCYSCGESDHQALCCPYLFYDQQRGTILKKLDQELHQIVRSFQRKIGNKTKCLLGLKKIHDCYEQFVIDNQEWINSDTSTLSLQVQDNLQLNNIDIPKLDSQNLDQYFHARGKSSSIGTLGTLRVREEKQPGDINGIYFDSQLDAHSMSSAFVKTSNTNNILKPSQQLNIDQHDRGNNAINNSSSVNSSSNNVLLSNNVLVQQKSPSVSNSILEEDEASNFNQRKQMHSSKLSNSPAAPWSGNLPIKYRSKSTHIKPSDAEKNIEEANSSLDIKAHTTKSPRPTTAMVLNNNASKPEQSLTRRNTTKTRNRVQSFNLDTTAFKDNTSPWRKPFEPSIFSYPKLDPRTRNTINEEQGSSLSAEDDDDDEFEQIVELKQQQQELDNSQRSFSHKEIIKSDKQSKPSDKSQQYQQQQQLMNHSGENNIPSFVNLMNNMSAVHSFRVFFPHNNVEHVLEVMNQKNRVNKKVKTHKFLKKNSHRSSKNIKPKRPLLDD